MAVLPRGVAAAPRSRPAPAVEVARPQLSTGTLTVAQPFAAEDADERGQRLREWAEDVWAAYRDRHVEVRGWLDAALLE